MLHSGFQATEVRLQRQDAFLVVLLQYAAARACPEVLL